MPVTPDTEQDRTQVKALAEAVQEPTGESVELAYVDRAYTGEEPDAEAHGIRPWTNTPAPRRAS